MDDAENVCCDVKDRETKRGAPQPIRHMHAAARAEAAPIQTAKRSVTRMSDAIPNKEHELDPNARLEKRTFQRRAQLPCTADSGPFEMGEMLRRGFTEAAVRAGHSNTGLMHALFARSIRRFFEQVNAGLRSSGLKPEVKG